MKKIKYILSLGLLLGLFGFSFGDVVSLNGTSYGNVISFEIPGYSNGITYIQSNDNSNAYLSRLGYFNNNGSIVYPTNFYSTEYQGYGATIDTDYLYPILGGTANQIVQSSFSTNPGYSLFTMSWNDSQQTLFPDFITYYQQGYNQAGQNYVINFSDATTYNYTYRYLKNTYARFFYRPGLTASRNTFWNQGEYTPDRADLYGLNPIDFQLFGPSNRSIGNQSMTGYFFSSINDMCSWGFYGRLGFYNVINSPNFCMNQAYSVTPGLSYGFSFTMFVQDSNFPSVLYTVLPFYDNEAEGHFHDGFYQIPSWAILSGVYMFKINADRLNTNDERIGVISTCTTSDGCDVNRFVYSEYNCNLPNNGLGIDPSSHYINVAESCTWIKSKLMSGGGVPVSNAMAYFLGMPIGDLVYNGVHYAKGGSPYISLMPASNGLYMKGLFFKSSSVINLNSTPLVEPLTVLVDRFYGDSTFDPLHNISNVDLGIQTSNTLPGSGNQLLDKLCNDSLYKNTMFCKNSYNTVFLSGDGSPYAFTTVTSGGKVFLALTDVSDQYQYRFITGENGELYVECLGDWCPKVMNVGYHGDGTINNSNGFMLSTGYYFDFFKKAGYFGKCPYDYTDINFGYNQGILSRINNLVGSFDIFLPINCSIAAFTAGMDYNFFDSFSSVGSGITSPLMGTTDIGLFRFFDFVLSLGLLIFIFVILHLIR